MMFFFQEVTNVGGIQAPFTIQIQTFVQLESMFTERCNKAISIDTTFGTNDVKLHLFILMMFDSHWIGIPIAWIIISQQTQNDLIKWLAPLRVKFLSRMHGQKPSCFIIDGAPQELVALW
jgi:hypothetical protein